MTLVMNYLLYFILYSFGGWVCECIYCSVPAKHFINRGFLAGPYCPIYGCGALLITWCLTPYMEYPLLVFLFGMIMTSVLEYVTSWIMEVLFHTKWWDYSKKFMNINGRVCLKNSILFGLMSLVVTYLIHPATADLIATLPIWIGNIIGLVFLIGFGIDITHTVRSLLHRNRTFLELEEAMSELKERFEQIGTVPGESMKERIQTVLNSTNADEKISAILQKTMGKLELPKKYTHVKNHLRSAFPNQHGSPSRETLEAIMETLQNYKNKHS